VSLPPPNPRRMGDEPCPQYMNASK
jgi:hypothetical protein